MTNFELKKTKVFDNFFSKKNRNFDIKKPNFPTILALKTKFFDKFRAKKTSFRQFFS